MLHWITWYKSCPEIVLGIKKCINAFNDLRAKGLKPGYCSSYDEGVYVMSSFISIHCLEIHNVSDHMVLICNTISTQHISAFTCNLQGLKNKKCVTLLVCCGNHFYIWYVKHDWKKFAYWRLRRLTFPQEFRLSIDIISGTYK